MVFDNPQQTDNLANACAAGSSNALDEIYDEWMKNDSLVLGDADGKGHNESESAKPKTSGQKGSESAKLKTSERDGFESVADRHKSKTIGRDFSRKIKGDLLHELDNNKYPEVQGKDRENFKAALQLLGTGSFNDLSHLTQFLPGGERKLSHHAARALGSILNDRGITAHVNTDNGWIANPLTEIILTQSDNLKAGFSNEGMRILIKQFVTPQGKEYPRIVGIDAVTIKSDSTTGLGSKLVGANLVKATHDPNKDLADIHGSILRRLVGKAGTTGSLSGSAQGSDRSRWLPNEVRTQDRPVESLGGELMPIVGPPPAEILILPRDIAPENDPKPIPRSADPAPIPPPPPISDLPKHL